MTKISVIMPVFNADDTIALSIESIINQSISCWEFIIVDDCSTDNTFCIVDEYGKRDKRIKILRNSVNLGLAKSLNIAIAGSKGEYIARMDADDISLSERFEEQVAILDRNIRIMVVGTAAYFVKQGLREEAPVVMPKDHADLLSSIFKRSPFIHPSVMMRREFLSLTNGYRDKYRRAQDYDLWLRGRFIGEYFNIQKPLIYYNSVNGRKFKSVENSIKIRFENAKTGREYLLSLFWSFYEAGLYSVDNLMKAFSRIYAKFR
jgi:glycosyltransferase involved in cell wall biosynthesis